MVKVFRYRVKSLNGLLNQRSQAVNRVWNCCNDTQQHALKWNKRWPGGFDLNVLTIGSGPLLGLHSGTVNAVCEQYAKSRTQKRKSFLRYRGRRSLGWVPFKGRDLKRQGNAFRLHGNTFRVFYSRALPEGKIKDGSCFARDARGRRYLNIVIELPDVARQEVTTGVGIDLGLKDLATLSTGQKIENPSHYTKSVLDAGWSSFRTMLRYKAIVHGAWFEKVNESGRSRVCSSCGGEMGPKGVADLGIREWVRCKWGVTHDRD